ncbi:hypothetical protein JG688_00001630 [Phytophthora aleatoria]|uniref:ZSWIM1/3 RNaseH-like domain-containing protein n=1 Tax=Phytophthora aleatoria TaxID=2496075 RepID=A0A8J5J3Y0_9STRA|nr:hypothetical protein JG688_00001630 [Phytophthora aleatoria]
MLHALQQLVGNDVLVIQDEVDVVCGVVMQTKVQKMTFERWGENLTMDFTHGVSNLGYHLGTCDKATLFRHIATLSATKYCYNNLDQI